LSARSQPNQPPSGDALRSAFDRAAPFTVGLEDEVMLLEPETLELAPRAGDVIAALDGDPRFKLELPASQVEILTTPARTVPEAATQLLDARRKLVERAGALVRPGGAGVPPLGSGIGELNRLETYAHTIEEYGPIARRQLVCALQVHVSVPGADRALAVYNAARSYLPWLAALAANGAFYKGHDSGLASVRPKLSELLPRQGVPPPISNWDEHAEALAWGAASTTFRSARTWWWELRPHPQFGTLEFRVPDAQATVADAAGIAAVAQALTAWLAERHDSGERLPVAASWRIEENRWSACRHGIEGTMADLGTGRPRSTRDGLGELIGTLAPVADRLGAGDSLGGAVKLSRCNGALVQRQVAADGGAIAVARSLAERFLEPWPG
jgi:carboxylate-amine ligase